MRFLFVVHKNEEKAEQNSVLFHRLTLKERGLRPNGYFPLMRQPLSVSRDVRKGSWTSLCNSVCTCSLFRPGSYAAACLFQLTLGNQRLAVVDQYPGFVVVLRTLLALCVGEAACGLGLQQLVAGSLLR